MAVRLMLGLCALLAATPAPAAPARVPQRIASLNLAADEILVAIVPIDRLVGVTAAGDDPTMSNVAGRVPRSVARFVRADMERLLALHPDLVVVSEYTDADFLHLLERTRLRVHRMQGLRSLSGIRRAILDLGDAVGAAPDAARLVERFDARLAALDRLLLGVQRPRVLYWSNPFTAGGDSAIGALIECGGAINVGRELGLLGLQSLGAERAFLADPDALVLALKQDADALRTHPLLSTLRAVRGNRLVHVSARDLATLSHHAADTCWALAHALHPERVPEERQ